METRRSFLKKASILSGGAGLMQVLPASIARAMAINPAAGSTYLDAEHIVFLMQENRSFDHTFGSLQGVRGFNDPRAISLPNKNSVWLQSDEAGNTFAPFRLNIKETKSTWMSSLPHSWGNQVDARNNGKYDRWLHAKHSGHKEYSNMPLTLGYHTREDIPFYYSLADAFTVCDQHFCSSLTGTTPNRLYFWTGTIREKQRAEAMARVWNEDADFDTMVSWTSFPEVLEEHNVSWKVYQNEVTVDVGFEGEEESWLSNFGDNPLEYFTQYHVKLHPEYIANLPKAAAKIKAAIQKQEQQLASAVAGSKEAEKATKTLDWLKKRQAANAEEQKIYTKEKYDALPETEKALHQKAFTTNRNDPDYHKLASLTYKDGDTERTVQLPKGDILHQFREDVNNGSLPAVSWIVAPENFSDHPSAAWYGAWYISEVMDILTHNPEVWKKTIFILTYDENDGYFDHVPPFVAPHPTNKDTGFTSTGIDTSVEYVANAQQQRYPDDARVSPIGLGYRVPFVIASPWTRGGWVNSEVCDHTSSLQFLEKFLSHKLGRPIKEPNMSNWRRTVCGDLTSAFRPYNGEKIVKPAFVQKEPFIESIHKAQYKKVPDNYRQLTAEDIALANTKPAASPYMPAQEKGIRNACSLPYELYADGNLSGDKSSFTISLQASNKIFGDRAAGSPFQVYAPEVYEKTTMRVWDFTVAAGDTLKSNWPVTGFINGLYHLRVHGPNGFYREFIGSKADPELEVFCSNVNPLANAATGTGRLKLELINLSNKDLIVTVKDNAYKTGNSSLRLEKNTKNLLFIETVKSHGWYDTTLSVEGYPSFLKRYAGHIETDAPSKTDPLMGRFL